MHLNQKKKKQKKGQKKAHFVNILKMNHRVLTIICLKNILILNNLLFWQKNYSKQKIKRKIMT